MFVSARCWDGRGRDATWFVFYFMHVIRWAFYFVSSGLCRVLSTHVGVTHTPLWVIGLSRLVFDGYFWWCGVGGVSRVAGKWYFDGGVDACRWIW